MKSLWKISRRYICVAILITVLLCSANLILFFYYSAANMENIGKNEIGRELMEEIVQEFSYEEEGWRLSEKGYEKLQESSFIWAMLLEEDGSVVWSYELPKELPTHYSIGEVASFSRWYLMDYPVRVWRNGEGLAVFGMEKDSVAKIQSVYDVDMIKRFPVMMKRMLWANLVFLVFLALVMAYRFYRSLKPIAEGIESLEKKETFELSEKGMLGDLAAKLNKTAALLRWQDEKLSKRDKARTDWIAGVSHDIRTPLALITGYADELAADTELGDETQKKAEVIRRQSLVIRQLISDLNLTSKLEYQSQPLKKEKFSPAGLLRECVAEYYNQGLSEKYEIELVMEDEVEESCMEGDTGLLMRCFRNLVGNSIRHNPDGALVTIAASKKPEGVYILFSDTGHGIPEKVIRVLLEKQNDSANTDTSASETGENVHVMGLRIAKQIVEAHDWKFCFAKRPQGGYDAQVVLLSLKNSKNR